jgi:hypothetical protein
MKKNLLAAMMAFACMVAVAPAAWPDSTADLINQLKHGDPKVRIEAAKEFAGG